jgi:hypothetical protein
MWPILGGRARQVSYKIHASRHMRRGSTPGKKGTRVPIGVLARKDARRDRREAESEETKEKRRATNTADKHKSRVAAKLKAGIMADSRRDRERLDAAVLGLLRKFGSLVNHVYQKCQPTFNGMPSLFSDMQVRQPRLPMRDLRREGKPVSMTICHTQIYRHDEVKFTSIAGYDSVYRAAWPNYRRTPFTIACAFDRPVIVRALVVDLQCKLDHNTNQEEGLVLIDDKGAERAWIMTGFDLTVEFGCLATFELLLALEHSHPNAAAACEYYGMPHDDLRALCKHNKKNRLTSCYDAKITADTLEEITHGTHGIGTEWCNLNGAPCAFCAGNK